MKFRQRIGLVLTVASLAVSAEAWAAKRGDLAGRVSAARSPLPTVTVYAYELANLELIKTVTDQKGSFFFNQLPAGLYKVIAFKKGFVPSVMMLRRATTDARQFVDVELVPEPGDGSATAISFWEVRQQIPGDVLRDIQLVSGGDLPAPPRNPILARAGSQVARVETRMGATTGVRETSDLGAADVNAASVGVSGRLNDFVVDFNGRFAELESQSSLSEPSLNPATGSTQIMNLRLENDGRSRINVASHSNRLTTASNVETGEVDFQHHRISWSAPAGRNGRTDVSAQYTSENNFYSEALLEPAGIPDASRSLRLTGRYSGNMSKKATIEAGVTYRERETDSLSLNDAYGLYLPAESVELFGRGGVTVQPAMIVQYGLYSTLRDGSLSFSPQGGLVVEFGPNWRASTSFSTRIDSLEQTERPSDFLTSYYGDADACRQGERYCYELGLSRLLGANESVSVGAVHRKIGETQRLYFSEDFFNRFDSLYLVEGDTLPELKFELTRRLTPSVLTRLQSNLAAGGGGLFRSTEAAPYENNIRYMVTSLDTQFESTSTGVFLAFHHLQQELEPMAGAGGSFSQFQRAIQPIIGDGAANNPQLELNRLQVVLSQDLDILHALASDWAVHLNMELSQGGATTDGLIDDDELRKRVTGGVAVKF